MFHESQFQGGTVIRGTFFLSIFAHGQKEMGSRSICNACPPAVQGKKKMANSPEEVYNREKAFYDLCPLFWPRYRNPA